MERAIGKLPDKLRPPPRLRRGEIPSQRLKCPLQRRFLKRSGGLPHVPPHQRLIFLSATAIGGAIRPAAIASHGPAPPAVATIAVSTASLLIPNAL